MSISWSEEQKKVIWQRGSNLLVSAAAGSGKTAVLVQRIIEEITDSCNPVDIDRLLVVTFTKAAASELKERLGKAITERMISDPGNSGLKKQSSLLHRAQICTIDSFCVSVMKDHFGEIGADPDFRIADKGEIRLLEEEVMERLFDEEYALEHEDFIALCDAYSGKRNDQDVRDMVSRIYHTSLSCPWPEEWIRGLEAGYTCADEESLMMSPIMEGCARTLYQNLNDIRLNISDLLSLARRGADKYVPVLEGDAEHFDGLSRDMTYAELLDFLQKIEWVSLPAIRKTDKADQEIKSLVQEERKKLKDMAEKLKSTYAHEYPSDILKQSRRLYRHVKELVRVSLLYSQRMKECKYRKKIAEFSDIEHNALRILIHEGSKEPSVTALQYRKHFYEIMIDEYQDSNLVQEEILKAVSGIPEGRYNMFMVGDVKQSIYRFRQARPELFMEKYDTYSEEGTNRQKIELHKNFRSRPEVVSFVNDCFYKLMNRDLGGVAYDSKAALYPEASYPENSGMNAEILLLEKKNLKEVIQAEDPDKEDEDVRRLEARMAASRIRRLMKETSVTDKTTGQLRPVQYRDIVILFRSLKEWGTSFTQVFEELGIPAHVETGTGYFSAYEVQAVLNMLRILDNPLQDIPMASVLKSPFAGMNDEELARIRIENKDLTFSQAVLKEMAEKEEGKIAAFAGIYTDLRKISRELPIHELIQHLYAITGFADIMASMPGGDRRSANLDMLVEKAIAYEKTSYKGLFHFVRYIDQLQKYEEDFGEADLTGENENTVRLMTIHKSKGLEFPIVFLCGLSKKFNKLDVTGNMILHPDLGMGISELTASPHIKRESIFRTQIAEELEQENLGEELRVLYVAMTRAKEKLILTAAIDSREKLYGKYTGNTLPGQPLRYMVRRKAGTYLDWIIPAVLSYPEKYTIDFADPYEMIKLSAAEAAEKTLDLRQLIQKIKEVPDDEIRKMTGAMEYIYPYASDISRKSKYSVSELKHASMVLAYDQSEGEAEIPEFIRHKEESYIPSFAREEADITGQGLFTVEKNGQISFSQGYDVLPSALSSGRRSEDGDYVNGVSRGALRGTAVHRVMECLDFAAAYTIDLKDEDQVHAFAEAERERMKKSGELSEEMAELVNLHVIIKFMQSPVFARMAEAAAHKLLFREKPFVMEHDGVLIQGIIDVFWMEKDDIVLLDYKTDHVEKPEELITRYRTQMDLYADALTRIFSSEKKTRQVKEKILYSFCFNCEVLV